MTELVTSRGVFVLEEIDRRLAALVTAEVNFAKAKVHIGMLINEVRVNKYWQEKYESFDAYVKAVELRFDRKRTQLYAYAGIVRDLLPEVGEDQLAEMGLEKAKLLGQVKRATGHLPTQDIINMAADDKVSRDEFRQVLLDAKKIPDLPSAKFRSIEYVADDDRQATISAAFLSVIRTENLTGAEEVQNGVVLECLAAEYLNTNPEVL